MKNLYLYYILYTFYFFTEVLANNCIGDNYDTCKTFTI